MTNIRIGFKTFRDLEKMDLGGLTEVRTALLKEVQRIDKLPNTPYKAQLAAAMNSTMQRNMAIIDRCGKNLINTAIPMPVRPPLQTSSETYTDPLPDKTGLDGT